MENARLESFATKKRDKIIQITKEQFLAPIKDEYVRRLSQTPIEQIVDDGYNPGPQKPDGTVNFECHCVAHLVASPCGHDFRKAISCQKAATDAELEKGKCTEEFFSFMKCAMKTQCFRSRDEETLNDPLQPQDAEGDH
ncbi:hypothetical protein niasHT_035094 [Heterodera trifolii]|uniref:CHCH domain-containing protein n=1 Tax=Heterodera trifolii TaxID=157864 RepID=A0ABD2IMA6_9BILA